MSQTPLYDSEVYEPSHRAPGLSSARRPGRRFSSTETGGSRRTRRDVPGALQDGEEGEEEEKDPWLSAAFVLLVTNVTLM